MNKLSAQIALFFYRATAIHVVISSAFFLIAQIVSSVTGDGSPVIFFSQYALIFLFSLILSGACYLFGLPLPKPVNFLIHYAVCAVCFYIIFVAAGNLSVDNPSDFLVSLFIYTMFYILMTGGVLLCRHLATRKQKKAAVKAGEASYQKRF